jgi:hypothetical protein
MLMVDNTHFSSFEDVLFDKEIQTLIAYPSNKIGAYDIPFTVETIYIYAFAFSKLETITLSDNIVYIQEGAFYGSQALTVSI